MTSEHNKTYDTVSKAVKAQYPKAFTTGVYTPSVEAFPCVAMVEINNVPYAGASTLTNYENLTYVTEEIEIFTKGAKASSQGFAICKIVDDEMSAMNYERTYSSVIPNRDDPDIWRYIMRYRKLI